MFNEESDLCEYCPNSHVVCENGLCKAECSLPSDVDPEDVVGSRCVDNGI